MHRRSESTTNSRSSGQRVDASKHLFSEGEKNVACLSSSVKLMKTSAAPYPERRKPIVMYLMSCTQQVRGARDVCHGKQRVSPFYRTTHASSAWQLHFCLILFDLVEQAFWRVPFFTEWIGASSFEVILAWPSKHSSTGTSSSGTSGFRRFLFILLHERIRRRIRLCLFFARLLISWRKLQLSPLEHCPLVSHCQQSPRILCPRCFVPFIISVSAPKILISNFLLDTSFYHCFQSVIIRS